MRPKLVILQPRKKFQVLEKNVFSKKQQQQKKFTPIFLNKCVLRYFSHFKFQ